EPMHAGRTRDGGDHDRGDRDATQETSAWATQVGDPAGDDHRPQGHSRVCGVVGGLCRVLPTQPGRRGGAWPGVPRTGEGIPRSAGTIAAPRTHTMNQQLQPYRSQHGPPIEEGETLAMFSRNHGNERLRISLEQFNNYPFLRL